MTGSVAPRGGGAVEVRKEEGAEGSGVQAVERQGAGGEKALSGVWSGRGDAVVAAEEGRAFHDAHPPRVEGRPRDDQGAAPARAEHQTVLADAVLVDDARQQEGQQGPPLPDEQGGADRPAVLDGEEPEEEEERRERQLDRPHPHRRPRAEGSQDPTHVDRPEPREVGERLELVVVIDVADLQERLAHSAAPGLVCGEGHPVPPWSPRDPDQSATGREPPTRGRARSKGPRQGTPG